MVRTGKTRIYTLYAIQYAVYFLPIFNIHFDLNFIKYYYTSEERDESYWQHCLTIALPSSSAHTSQASFLSPFLRSLPSPVGPQLKTLLMSSNWQRLHHLHTSFCTVALRCWRQSGLLIVFLLLFLGCSISLLDFSWNLGATLTFTTWCCLNF